VRMWHARKPGRLASSLVASSQDSIHFPPPSSPILMHKSYLNDHDEGLMVHTETGWSSEPLASQSGCPERYAVDRPCSHLAQVAAQETRGNATRYTYLRESTHTLLDRYGVLMLCIAGGGSTPRRLLLSGKVSSAAGSGACQVRGSGQRK